MTNPPARTGRVRRQRSDSRRRDEIRRDVRGIVRRWGWNGTSYQILNPGFAYWIDRERDAVVGYVERHGVRVVGGAPVCADEQLVAVVAGFEAESARSACGVIYFAAEERLAALAARDARRITFPIGAQPVWRPGALVHEFATHASLRAQLSRARNKGVTTRHVRAIDAGMARALHGCLQEWIDRRGLPPLHFLIETETLHDLDDRRLLVAEQGGVVGFLIATPIPARNGWLVEQLVRGGGAPNGTAELLLHHLATMLDRENAAMMTLGLAPLARRGRPAVNRAPRWLSALLAGLRAHGRRFYNFEGLERFKSKFGEAEWDPVYVSVGPETRLARAMLAVTAAFSGEPVRRFVRRAAGRMLERRMI